MQKNLMAILLALGLAACGVENPYQAPQDVAGTSHIVSYDSESTYLQFADYTHIVPLQINGRNLDTSWVLPSGAEVAPGNQQILAGVFYKASAFGNNYEGKTMLNATIAPQTEYYLKGQPQGDSAFRVWLEDASGRKVAEGLANLERVRQDIYVPVVTPR